MYHIESNGLYFNARRLGPANALYSDQNELTSLGPTDGVIRRQMPGRVDLIFTANNRIILCESKRTDDLIQSTRKRRLSRQLRALRAMCSDTDIVAVVLRGGLPSFSDPEYADIMRNIVAMQMLGVVLLPVPVQDKDVPAVLASYRPLLADDSRSALIAIAGTDEVKIPSGESLLTSVKGLGPAALARLRKECGPTTLDILKAGDEAWQRAKISATLRHRLASALL